MAGTKVERKLFVYTKAQLIAHDLKVVKATLRCMSESCQDILLFVTKYEVQCKKGIVPNRHGVMPRIKGKQ